ncbi:MAG: DNA adenine methylase [Gammaproteobacteria bacterium]
MRFIGSKKNLLPFLDSQIRAVGKSGGVFCDLFAGTAAVGRHFKENGFSVLSTDMLYFSYVLQKTYLELKAPPGFAGLMPHVDAPQHDGVFQNGNAAAVIGLLNSLDGEEGFIYRHYCPEGTRGGRYVRRYFTADNAKKIDAIRARMENWRERKWIDESEHFYLLCALIEAVPFVSNISGTYSAFLKTWDARAHKKLRLDAPKIIAGKGKHLAANEDCASFIARIRKSDIMYLDPPYNSRQYAPNYHILETIARWDFPAVRGVTGMRDYQKQKSAFCNRASALRALSHILETAKYRHLMLSYNDEGVLSQDDILSVFRRHGKVRVVEKEYPRYKSNSNGAGNRRITERVYCLKQIDPKNALNDLGGAEWLFFLQSIDSTAYSTRGEEGFAHDMRRVHPSPKPPQLMRKYVEFFTKEGQTVLDPFMGVGGALLAASLCERKAVGVDLSSAYIDVYGAVCKRLHLKKQKTIAGDSLHLKSLLPRGFSCDMILTDPPYGEMLSKKRSGQRKKDTGKSEATPFTDDSADLGNMSRRDFLASLQAVLAQAVSFLKEKGYVVVFAKDMQPAGKEHNMLHCAVTETLLNIPSLSFRGYKIWHDRTPKLYPFGYPHAFVANQLHQFALIFRKEVLK